MVVFVWRDEEEELKPTPEPKLESWTRPTLTRIFILPRDKLPYYTMFCCHLIYCGGTGITNLYPDTPYFDPHIQMNLVWFLRYPFAKKVDADHLVAFEAVLAEHTGYFGGRLLHQLAPFSMSSKMAMILIS